MKCDFCNTAEGKFYLLPVRVSNDLIYYVVCRGCAEKYPTFCKEHDLAHMAYTDGTSACLRCINRLVMDNQNRITETAIEVFANLKKEKFSVLSEWATKQSGVAHKHSDYFIYYAVCAYAVRFKLDFELALSEICSGKGKQIIPALMVAKKF